MLVPDKVEEGPDSITVHFSLERGLTRDLRAHRHLFAIPKNAAWKAS